jgi:GMP synthase (glutamine-hydrolysing)
MAYLPGMEVLAIQHVPFETPGAIAEWAAVRAVPLRILHPYAGDALPDLAFPGLLVVLGGPMNVDEEEAYPWLAEEKALLAARAARDLPTLGICLGAQLLAAALGAPVTPHPEKEIGWFPVRLTDAARSCGHFADFPEVFPALHWHGDRFGLPEGALHLATSGACAQQAFLVGTCLVGLQFHLEATLAGTEALLVHAAGDLAAAGESRWVAQAPAIRRGCLDHSGLAVTLLFRLLDRLGACCSTQAVAQADGKTQA